MKRTICILLAACFVLLPACTGQTEGEQGKFYYCRAEYAYDTEDAILVSEQRNISGHAGDLTYLLSMYLLGPLDENLRSPFPGTTKLLSLRHENNSIYLEISDCSEHLTEVEFSLGCACLALTCLGLTDSKYVTITSGDQKITLNESIVILYDNTELATASAEEIK